MTRIEVARLDFPILRTKEEFEHGNLPENLAEAQRAIVSAQHLVVIFPLWHGTMPALLKAFIEQVMRPGVALEYREHGFPKGLLTGRSARTVALRHGRSERRGRWRRPWRAGSSAVN